VPAHLRPSFGEMEKHCKQASAGVAPAESAEANAEMADAPA
jgi:hypothetical protein